MRAEMIEAAMTRPDLVTRDQAIAPHDLHALAQVYGGPVDLLLKLAEIGHASQNDHPELFAAVARWPELTTDERAGVARQVREIKARVEALGISIPEPVTGRDASRPLRW